MTMFLVISRPDVQSHREKLCEILHSHKAQYAVITLVIVDMIIVIAELLLDLRAIEGERCLGTINKVLVIIGHFQVA